MERGDLICTDFLEKSKERSNHNLSIRAGYLYFIKLGIQYMQKQAWDR